MFDVKKIFFLLVFLFFYFDGFPQENNVKIKIDSLQKLLKTTKKEKRIANLLLLSDIYSNKQLDTCLYWAKRAQLEIKEVNNDSLKSIVYNSLANAYEYKGLLDSALLFHKKALYIRLKLTNNLAIADTYNNIGIVYDQKGNFENALRYYFKALSLYDKYKEKTKSAMALTNIGVVYKEQKEYKKAFTYYKKANEIYQILKDDFGSAVTYGNMGSVLIDLSEYKKAIFYSDKAKNIYSQIKYERYIPYTISNIGIAQDSLKNFNVAEKNYSTAIALHKKYGNTYEVVNMYNILTKCLIKQKKYKQALEIATESKPFLEQANSIKLNSLHYNNLASLFSGLENFEKAFYYSQKFIETKDSLFKNEKTKAVFELEAKYENEKKEKLLIKKEIETKNKSTAITILIILVSCIILVSALLYRQQRIKNKQIIKENQLKEALLEIENQNKLQEQRIIIARDLHDNIGAQLTFIISSIDNLKYFDLAKNQILSKYDQISGFTKNTITELRDTIWAMNKNEINWEDLEIRINNFINQAQIATKGITFKIENNSNTGSNLKFSSLQGMNLYRIIQETINNAIKHANCSVITLQIDWQKPIFKLAIKDNGIGYNQEVNLEGNGINNIKKRAEEIEGVLTIFSKQNEGTKILVELTLTNV